MGVQINAFSRLHIDVGNGLVNLSWIILVYFFLTWYKKSSQVSAGPWLVVVSNASLQQVVMQLDLAHWRIVPACLYLLHHWPLQPDGRDLIARKLIHKQLINLIFSFRISRGSLPPASPSFHLCFLQQQNFISKVFLHTIMHLHSFLSHNSI